MATFTATKTASHKTAQTPTAFLSGFDFISGFSLSLGPLVSQIRGNQRDHIGLGKFRGWGRGSNGLGIRGSNGGLHGMQARVERVRKYLKTYPSLAASLFPCFIFVLFFFGGREGGREGAGGSKIHRLLGGNLFISIYRGDRTEEINGVFYLVLGFFFFFFSYTYIVCVYVYLSLYVYVCVCDIMRVKILTHSDEEGGRRKGKGRRRRRQRGRSVWSKAERMEDEKETERRVYERRKGERKDLCIFLLI